MDSNTFWNLVTRHSQILDFPTRNELLYNELKMLTPRSIAIFENLYERELHKLYSWKVWGVGYVLYGGCSDDNFRGFRAGIVSLGKGFAIAVLKDPDIVATLGLPEIERIFDYDCITCTYDAYLSITGKSIPNSTQYSRTLRGRELDWNDHQLLKQKYPKCWQLVREE